MSSVSDDLQARESAAAPAPATLLSELRPGSHARVSTILPDTEPAVARRLQDLGFVPGADVAVVRRAPMADPVVFRIAGSELALRRAQARCIRVSA